MKRATEAQQKKVITDLHRELASQELVVEKLRNRIEELEDKVQDTLAYAEGYQQQLSEKEKAHLEALREGQRQLELAHEGAEKLNQEKQNLRHKLVRLAAKAKGQDNDSLPNMVKRPVITSPRRRRCSVCAVC